MAELCWMRKALVHLGLAPVVEPGHAELDHPFGLDEALEQGVARRTAGGFR